MQLIKDKDVTLFYQFELQNIQPHFFAFRWLTLLFSQEFILPGNSTCKVGLIQFLLRAYKCAIFGGVCVVKIAKIFVQFLSFVSDLMRIWDSLFADEKRFEFLLYVACAMLL